MGDQGQGPQRKRFQQQDPTDFVPRRKLTGQRPVDYFCSAINHVKTRLTRDANSHFNVPPHPYHCKDLLPTRETWYNASTALCTQWAHTIFYSENRQLADGRRRRAQFTLLKFAPTGRRILAGTSNGEFLLYNGHGFGIEMRTMAHEDSAVKAAAWGKVSDIIVSGDDNGVVKFWQGNLNNVSRFDSLQRAIREISWAPGELRFVTAGQDGSARIWDTQTVGAGSAEVETKLEGHGGDVHTVNWHPHKSLILTGSQDRDARLWDPRKGSINHIATLQGHAQPVTSVRWNDNGHWFLTASRDSTVKLWDLRTLKEISYYQGHSKDVMNVEWHPTHPNLFASAGVDGDIAYWTVVPGDGYLKPDGVREVTRWTASVNAAHDEYRGTPNSVTDIQWSPMGHILASCANEIKIWTRNKPGAVEEVRSSDTGDFIPPSATTGSGGMPGMSWSARPANEAQTGHTGAGASAAPPQAQQQ